MVNSKKDPNPFPLILSTIAGIEGTLFFSRKAGKMIRASLTGRLDDDVSSAVGTITVDGGDVKLKASITDADFNNGLSFNTLLLSLEKPSAFIIDYDFPKRV